MACRRAVCIVVTASLFVGCGEAPIEPEVTFQAATSLAGPPIVSTSERIPLPPPPGYTFPHPRHVNRHGQVAGTAVALNPRRDVGVLWERGTPIELPGLPGNPLGNPAAINDAGQILGAVAPAGGGLGVSVVWENGTVTSLSDLTGNDLFIGADINNAGWIAGSLGVSPRVAALWAEGQVTVLPTPAGYGNTFGSRVGGGLILGETSRLVGNPSGPPTQESAFVIWDRDGSILWTEDNHPRPFPGGTERWVGITRKGDAYIKNTGVGALWRWRDGELAPWPNPNDPGAANAMAVSPSGLVLGGLMENSAYTTLGVWKGKRFYAFDDQDMWCIDISDKYVLCGQGDRRSFTILDPFIAKLAFDDEQE